VKGKYDLMIVGCPGFKAVVLAKFFLTRKPVVFNAFVSMYDSLIYDRRQAGKYSYRAFSMWFYDWCACFLADRVLLDTLAHIDYFVKTFRLPREKFVRVLVGSDNDRVYPVECQKGLSGRFRVHFHGSYIPLQGIEYIIRAAKLLENEHIDFTLIGGGQTYRSIQQLARELNIRNVKFKKKVPYDMLRQHMSCADICLGIFGNTAKAKRVIPNKLYESLAAKCPTLTGESPAAKELLTVRKDVLFCNMADAEDLAEKIRELKDDPHLRERIAQNGHKLFLEQAIPKKIAKKLLEDISSIS